METEGAVSEKCRDGPVLSIVGVKEAPWSSKLAVELGESGPAKLLRTLKAKSSVDCVR